jgi:aldehyde dehydrogenase (NAD(P)+)
MTTTDQTGHAADDGARGMPLDDSRRRQLDAAISDLAAGEEEWAATPLRERADLLARVHSTVAGEAERWVDAAIRAKRLDQDSPYVGEEWITGPYSVLSALAALGKSISALAGGVSPIERKKLGSAPGNRVTVPVLPSARFDRILLHGFRADVWMKPGISPETARASAGLGARSPRQTGGVGLVLGAGNITSIPPLDVLYQLIAYNRVTVLKLNPVMDPLADSFAAAFRSLIEFGVLRIVSGGADVGGYLAHHPGISHVHITGSATTHDLVVWGSGEGAEGRKSAGIPLLQKPITSELGGVAPVIVIPGAWSKADLKFQAEHVATQRLHNAGHNCIAAQVVVLSSDWPQREAFLAELRTALASAPARTAWYPGSGNRLDEASASYPRAERLGTGGDRLLVRIGADDDASAVQSTEYFSPVLGVVEIPGTGATFLDAAVERVNRDFLGSLGANILALPSTIRRLGSAFETALAQLEYGTIAVNAWTGVGFLSAGATWGAFPGHALQNVQSGIGIVHNAFLLDGAERTVVRGPFRPFPRSIAHGEFALSPKPPWFVSARTARQTGQLLSRFAAQPSVAKLPAVLNSAFRA